MHKSERAPSGNGFREILCYGDSNTYGYDPREPLGGRYPTAVRWTGRLAHPRRRHPRLPVLLTAPPPMAPGAWVTEARLLSESARLAACYRELAERTGILFADAGRWGVELLFDGVHFSPAGHAAFAAGMLNELPRLTAARPAR